MFKKDGFLIVCEKNIFGVILIRLITRNEFFLKKLLLLKKLKKLHLKREDMVQIGRGEGTTK